MWIRLLFVSTFIFEQRQHRVTVDLSYNFAAAPSLPPYWMEESSFRLIYLNNPQTKVSRRLKMSPPDGSGSLSVPYRNLDGIAIGWLAVVFLLYDAAYCIRGSNLIRGELNVLGMNLLRAWQITPTKAPEENEVSITHFFPPWPLNVNGTQA